jgi:hypothetical protein
MERVLDELDVFRRGVWLAYHRQSVKIRSCWPGFAPLFPGRRKARRSDPPLGLFLRRRTITLFTRSDLGHFGSAEAAFDDLVRRAYSDDAMMFDRENRNGNGNRRHCAIACVPVS